MNSVLTVAAVSKYFGGLQAISNLSFYIEENSITAIIGPNGAGKTTLFNLINGLLKLDSGTIHFANTRIDTCKSYQITYLGISRTFQNLGTFTNMSVLDNIKIGQYVNGRSGFFSSALNLKKCRREESEIQDNAFTWLEFMGVEQFWDRQLTEIPFEKQRLVEIARALSSNPRMLLLDEPAAGLNITETRNLITNINRIRKLGITILIVEHDMDLVMDISDKIIVLNFGEKIAEGTPKEIQKNEKVIAVYLGSSF